MQIRHHSATIQPMDTSTNYRASVFLGNWRNLTERKIFFKKNANRNLERNYGNTIVITLVIFLSSSASNTYCVHAYVPLVFNVHRQLLISSFHSFFLVFAGPSALKINYRFTRHVSTEFPFTTATYRRPTVVRTVAVHCLLLRML